MRLLRVLGAAACLAALAVAWALLSGTGNDAQSPDQSIPVAEGAPAFCQQLAELPAGLNGAIQSAALGDPSPEDKVTVDRAITQLRDAAGNDTTPASLRTILNRSADVLDKVVAGQQITEREARTFSDLGEAVDQKCTG